MNCSNWEERIALYVGGDLQPSEAAEVERHLSDCPGCQVFASGLRESLEVLQEAHGEPLAEAHLAAVRARVMAEIESAGQPWWRKVWVYGLAVAAAALFVIASLHRQAPMPQRHLAVQAPPAPAVIERPEVVPVRVGRVRRVRHRVHPAVAHFDPGPPIVVKLVTDDPDVVIYWITDKSGE